MGLARIGRGVGVGLGTAADKTLGGAVACWVAVLAGVATGELEASTLLTTGDDDLPPRTHATASKPITHPATINGQPSGVGLGARGRRSEPRIVPLARCGGGIAGRDAPALRVRYPIIRAEA